jgi:hypothetical protein
MAKFKVEIENDQFSPYLSDSIVHQMVFNTDFLKRCFRNIDSHSFTDERRVVVKLCYDYFKQYKKAPSDYIIGLADSYAKTHGGKKNLLNKYLIRLADLDVNEKYVNKNLKTFAQNGICQSAIEAAQVLTLQGKIDKAQKKILQEFKRAYAFGGTSIENDLDCKENLEDSEDEFNMKTMIDPYDKVVGGFVKPELHLVFGDTNIGKSYYMVFLTEAALIQGKKVLFVTLETSKKKLKRRLAGAILGRAIRTHGGMITDSESHASIKKTRFINSMYKDKKDYLKKRGGKLWWHEATHFTMDDLNELLDSIELMQDAIPDLIIIDSPRQMRSDVKYKEYRYGEEEKYVDLLDMSKDRNATIAVTEQANRKAGDSLLVVGKHMGEAYAKLQIVDSCNTLTQTMDMYKRGKLWIFNCKNRGAAKNTLIEVQQSLHTGQFILNAKLKEVENAYK